MTDSDPEITLEKCDDGRWRASHEALGERVFLNIDADVARAEALEALEDADPDERPLISDEAATALVRLLLQHIEPGAPLPHLLRAAMMGPTFGASASPISVDHYKDGAQHIERAVAAVLQAADEANAFAKLTREARIVQAEHAQAEHDELLRLQAIFEALAEEAQAVAPDASDAERKRWACILKLLTRGKPTVTV